LFPNGEKIMAEIKLQLTLDDLPDDFKWKPYAEVAGIEALLHLAEVHGGEQLNIPGINYLMSYGRRIDTP
jgi:hypothetical protein